MFHTSGSRSTLLALTACAVLSACQSTQQSNVSVDYYRISGNSTAALDSEIKRKGPRINGGQHAVAVARIRMIPNIAFDNQGDTCGVSESKVAVNARVTLPQWIGRKTASAKLGEAWDNIDRYTRLHEAMHVNIAFKFAGDIEEELENMKPASSCKIMRARANRLVDRRLKEHDQAQRDFDANEQRQFAMLAKQQKIGGAK